MPTAKHRIAAYLPPDVDEKFQAFKKKRGVGDSQALILILSEFLKVSHQVSCSDSLNIEALRSELLDEIEDELEIRFSELRSELLNKPLESVEIAQESLKEVRISHDSLKAVNVDIEMIEQLTIAEIADRFGCTPSLVRKQKSKYKDEPEKFIVWSKSRDPDERGWKFDEEAKLFAPADG
jgi:hypothetical protein